MREGDILFQPLPHEALMDAVDGVTRPINAHCSFVEWNPFGE